MCEAPAWIRMRAVVVDAAAEVRDWRPRPAPSAPLRAILAKTLPSRAGRAVPPIPPGRARPSVAAALTCAGRPWA
eukprot:15431609-Alexandrium_andersonii.AAC.1